MIETASTQKATFRKGNCRYDLLHSSSAASITGQVFKVEEAFPIFELHDFQFSEGLHEQTIVWFRKDLRLRDNPTLNSPSPTKEKYTRIRLGRGRGWALESARLPVYGFIKLSKA